VVSLGTPAKYTAVLTGFFRLLLFLLLLVRFFLPVPSFPLDANEVSSSSLSSHVLVSSDHLKTFPSGATNVRLEPSALLMLVVVVLPAEAVVVVDEEEEVEEEEEEEEEEMAAEFFGRYTAASGAIIVVLAAVEVADGVASSGATESRGRSHVFSLVTLL